MKLQSEAVLRWVYLTNASVLITHEIDSAYWHEWELFGIPGGLQFFLVINFILILAVLWGYQELNSGHTSGYILACILAAGGLFAFLIHGYFLLNGNNAFRLPIPIAILFATLLLSTWQIFLLIKLKAGIRGTKNTVRPPRI